MNKGKIRAQFKQYRQTISELQCKIDNLQEVLSSANYHCEESISRANARTRAAENERAERERQAESDRWFREDEIRRATKDLERAQGYGDPYSIHRAMDKLKHVSL